MISPSSSDLLFSRRGYHIFSFLFSWYIDTHGGQLQHFIEVRYLARFRNFVSMKFLVTLDRISFVITPLLSTICTAI